MARPYVAMVDYGTGNVHSLGKALERVGCTPRLTRDADELAGAAGIVLPGVGAFGPAWQRLEATGLIPVLRELVAAGRPLLGICLGMQLLFEGSREDGDWPGLGFLPGWVEPFVPGVAPGCAPDRGTARAGHGTPPGGPETPRVPAGRGTPPGGDGTPAAELKVPHMGWNRVRVPAGSRLLAGLEDGFFAYFVHSYRVPWPPGPGGGGAGPAGGGAGGAGGAPGRTGGGSAGAGDGPGRVHRGLDGPGDGPERQGDGAGPAGDGPRRPGDGSGRPGSGGAGTGPLVALADYGGPFVAAVEWGPVCGTQFHPEKSGPAGLKILRNFGAMCGACDPSP